MRDYAKALPVMWTRGSFRALRGKPVAQVLAFYLFTNPHTRMCGIFYLPLPTIVHETGLSLETVKETLPLLSELDMVHHDPAEDLFYLPAGARTQIGESLSRNDKRWKGLRRDLQGYSGHPFHLAFLRKYSDAYEMAEDLEDSEVTLAEAPSKPLRSQYQDQEQKQEQDNPPKAPQGGPLLLATPKPETEPLSPLAPPETPPPPKSGRRQRRQAATEASPDFDAVFGAYLAGWRRVRGRGAAPVATPERRALVAKRLADGFTTGQLEAAAAGIWCNDWNVSEGRTSLELALRDAERVERFAADFERRQVTRSGFPTGSPPELQQDPALASVRLETVPRSLADVLAIGRPTEAAS